MRRLFFVVMAAAAAAWIPASPASSEPSRSGIEIPGGTHAVSCLLGHVDTDPARFLASVDRALLRRVRVDQDVRQVPARVDLTAHLEIVASLERRYPDGVAMSPSGDAASEAFVTLAEYFGYSTGSGRSPDLDESSRASPYEERRRTAYCLGWNLRAVARRLAGGETVRLEIPRDEVATAVPLEVWSRIVSRPIDAASAFATLVSDQRLGLVLDGLARLDPATRSALDPAALERIYRDSAIPFRRYARALSIRDGAVVPPGGSGAAGFWQHRVKARLTDPARFVHALLLADGGRWANLWHALWFAPSEVASAVAVTGAPAEPRSVRDLERFYDRMTAARPGVFDGGPFGSDASLTLRLSAPRAGLASLVDGDGVREAGWLLPRNADAEPCRALGPSTGRGALLAIRGVTPWLAAPERVDDEERTLLDALRRVADLAGASWRSLDPRTLARLRRTIAFRAAALDPLAAVRPVEETTLSSYLDAAEALDCLEPGPSRDALALGFQGGVELLATLARNGVLRRSAIDAALLRWSELHVDPSLAVASDAGRVAWLRDLVASLPEAPPGTPARGPLETKLVAAIASDYDDVRFRWQGVEYGRAREAVAAAMRRFLELQGVASVDRLAGITARAGDYEQVLSGPRGPVRTEVARGLVREIRALPGAETIRPGETDAPRLAAILRHRDAAIEAIEALDRRDDEKTRAAVQEALGLLLARELQATLTAVTYLGPVTTLDDPSLGQPLLAFKHRLSHPGPAPPGRIPPGSSAWSPARLVPASRSEIGAYVEGRLGGTARALAGHAVLRLDPGRPPHTWAHVRPWLAALPAMHGARVDLLVPRLVAEARAAGRLDPDPRHRATPASELASGLELAESGRPGASTVRATLGIMGADWRERLGAALPPTPTLSGGPVPLVGEWPPYEALEYEGGGDALDERELLDLWAAVYDFAGRQGLPPIVAQDLLLATVEAVPAAVALDSETDWRALTDWVERLDDAFFKERLRECLVAGRYRALSF